MELGKLSRNHFKIKSILIVAIRWKLYIEYEKWVEIYDWEWSLLTQWHNHNFVWSLRNHICFTETIAMSDQPFNLESLNSRVSATLRMEEARYRSLSDTITRLSSGKSCSNSANSCSSISLPLQFSTSSKLKRKTQSSSNRKFPLHRAHENGLFFEEHCARRN